MTTLTELVAKIDDAVEAATKIIDGSVQQMTTAFNPALSTETALTKVPDPAGTGDLIDAPKNPALVALLGQWKDNGFILATVGGPASTLNVLSLSANSVQENTAAGTVVGVVQGVTAGATLALTSNPGNYFGLLNGQIVRTGTPLDYEALPAGKSVQLALTETKAGVSNSPRVTNITIVVGNDVSDDPAATGLAITGPSIIRFDASGANSLEKALGQGIAGATGAVTITVTVPIVSPMSLEERDGAASAVVGNNTPLTLAQLQNLWAKRTSTVVAGQLQQITNVSVADGGVTYPYGGSAAVFIDSNQNTAAAAASDAAGEGLEFTFGANVNLKRVEFDIGNYNPEGFRIDTDVAATGTGWTTGPVFDGVANANNQFYEFASAVPARRVKFGWVGPGVATFLASEVRFYEETAALNVPTVCPTAMQIVISATDSTGTVSKTLFIGDPDTPGALAYTDTHPLAPVTLEFLAGDSDVATATLSGTLTLDKLKGEPKFRDPLLQADAPDNKEYGHDDNEFVQIGGVRFYAKSLRTIGGIYGSAPSYDLMIFSDKVDFAGGYYGHATSSKRHYAPPFRVRVKNAAGQVIGLIQGFNGTAINSNTHNYKVWGATGDDPAKPKVGFCPAGTVLYFRSGGRPQASAANRATLPRAEAARYPDALCAYGAARNGYQTLFPNENGSGMIYAMPEVPKPATEIAGMTVAAFNDPRVFPSSAGIAPFLRLGWRYFPGNFGPKKGCGGQGGAEDDRSPNPAEGTQNDLQGLQTNRPYENTPWSDISEAETLACFNLPFYRVNEKVRLTPADPIAADRGATLPSATQRVLPKRAYYGYTPGQFSQFEPYSNFIDYVSFTQAADAFGSADQQQTAVDSFSAEGADGKPPMGNYSASHSHMHHTQLADGARLFARPAFSTALDFYIAEVMGFAANGNVGGDENTFSIYYNPGVAGANQCLDFLGSTDPIQRAPAYALLALVRGYQEGHDAMRFNPNRCRQLLRLFFINSWTYIFSKLPTQTTQNQFQEGNRLSWQRFGCASKYDPDIGWAMVIHGVTTEYLARATEALKRSGLWDEFLAENNAALTGGMTGLSNYLKASALTCRYIPWAAQPMPLDGWESYATVAARTVAQGATADPATLPADWATVYANNPQVRGDNKWFLDADGSTRIVNERGTPSTADDLWANLIYFYRFQVARSWWQHLAPAGDVAAGVATINSHWDALITEFNAAMAATTGSVTAKVSAAIGATGYFVSKNSAMQVYGS